MISVLHTHPRPVLSKRSPGAEGIRYGFEGGRVVKVGNTYHLFTSEMAGPPIWVNMRLAHWTSPDRLTWTRQSTLRQSTGTQDGQDERAALWSPLPAWDPDHNEWNLFYVAYKSLPNTPQKFLANHDGRICRAVSLTKGPEGISGPFEDRGIILQPGPNSQPWEGLQGVDSFFPWKCGPLWRAFYGSARSEVTPVAYWRVGTASSPTLSGPWLRDPQNPSPIEPRAIENPLVEQIPQGWLTVYDKVDAPNAFGYSFSPTGLHWPPGTLCHLGPTWSTHLRTPMGLIHEGNNTYTMFYTAFETGPDWAGLIAGTGEHSCAIGFAELEIKL